MWEFRGYCQLGSWVRFVLACTRTLCVVPVNASLGLFLLPGWKNLEQILDFKVQFEVSSLVGVIVLSPPLFLCFSSIFWKWKVWKCFLEGGAANCCIYVGLCSLLPYVTNSDKDRVSAGGVCVSVCGVYLRGWQWLGVLHCGYFL